MPRPASILSIIRDTILIGSLIGIINYFLARDDAGWLALNPTPWLLLPPLIGARYGVWPGALTGLLTAAVLTVVRARIEGTEEWIFAANHRYPLTALALTGFLAGELNNLLRGGNAKLATESTRMKQQLDRVKAELALVSETRHELQNALTLHDAHLTGLDVELRKVALLPAHDVFTALLNLLHRLAGISSAGFYTRSNGSLRRIAALHPTAALSEHVALDESPLAIKALTENTIAAVSDPLESSERQPFLAAVPWNDADASGLLLIQDMPADSFEWRNLTKIELILHWAFAIRRHADAAKTGGGPRKIVSLEDFMFLLAQSLETEQIHHLPSAVLRLDFPDADNIPSSMDRELATLLPATTVTTRLPSGSLVFLIPFGSDQQAQSISRAFKERLPSARPSHHLVVGPAELETFWSRILES